MSTSKKILIILSALLFRCQEPESDRSTGPDTNREYYLVSATAGETTARTTLQLLASVAGQSDVSSHLKHDVKSFKITYHTTYKGDTVEASGVMMIPAGKAEPASIISLQHGTEFKKEGAPSQKDGLLGIEFFASAGYVALMPDYLGYGSTSNLFHPYYDRDHSASTVIDFVKAAKEFLEKEKISVNDQLYLAGYSEGGYVTLAAASEIDHNTDHGLTVAAVAAGAGGYDLSGMLKSVTSEDYYAYPSYLAYVLTSYNELYDWNRPLDYFFNKKYADAVSSYLNGSYSASYVNSKLTTKVSDLLAPEFLNSLRKDGEQKFKEALKQNTIEGWTTSVPLRLYHGTKDEIIPYSNTLATLDQFKVAGSSNVVLIPLEGGKHGDSFQRMLVDFVPWFLTL